MAKTTAQLEQLSYRELQTECKEAGLPAKGTKADLLGKLIIHYKAAPAPATKAPAAAATLKKRSSSRATAKSTEPLSKTPSSSSRRSLDAKTIKEAFSTPLPGTPTPAKAAKSNNRRVKKSSLKLATATAILAAIIAALLMFCQTNSCPAAVDNAVSTTTHHAKLLAASARHNSRKYTNDAIQLAHTTTEAASQYVQDSYSRVKTVITAVTNPNGDSSSSGSSTNGGSAFNGVLDSIALTPIVNSMPVGEEWDNARRSLKDVWGGNKLNENKANVVLFACESKEDQDIIAKAVEAAAPPSATLILPQNSIPTDKGVLQKTLVDFLSSQPRGVVLIEGMDTVSLESVPVLINVMGEYGALTSDGRAVSATGASFFLTMDGSADAMSEENESAFVRHAKVALSSALLEQMGDAEDEVARVNVRALRRRIDMVVKVGSVFRELLLAS